jgi:hypothetical protein
MGKRGTASRKLYFGVRAIDIMRCTMLSYRIAFWPSTVALYVPVEKVPRILKPASGSSSMLSGHCGTDSKITRKKRHEARDNRKRGNGVRGTGEAVPGASVGADQPDCNPLMRAKFNRSASALGPEFPEMSFSDSRRIKARSRPPRQIAECARSRRPAPL